MSEEKTRLDTNETVANCLERLKRIRATIATRYENNLEFFDFGLAADRDPNETLEERVEHLVRACVWNALAVKIEFNLKLLYSIDGYLTAVNNKNPVSTSLMARHLLELVATVSAIDFELRDCLTISMDEWERRASAFLAVLLRARYATSDAQHKPIFAEAGVPETATKPIRISKAIKRLAGRPHFGWVHTMYGELSNLCHHNGSGHILFPESARLANSITLPDGSKLFLKEKTPILNIRYPASHLASTSLTRTAQAAWRSAESANEMLRDLREAPFTDRELRRLTHNRRSRLRIVDVSIGIDGHSTLRGKMAKPRRNDPCPCGSGKKYKHCCSAN